MTILFKAILTERFVENETVFMESIIHTLDLDYSFTILFQESGSNIRSGLCVMGEGGSELAIRAIGNIINDNFE